MFDDVGETTWLEKGHEFGATTGRPRRCGWFDAAALRQAVEINSISGLCLTKLDVLDSLPVIRICTGYENDGEAATSTRFDAENYARMQPIYEELPGWQTSTAGIKRLEELPVAARACDRAILYSSDARLSV